MHVLYMDEDRIPVKAQEVDMGNSPLLWALEWPAAVLKFALFFQCIFL